jgi:hypothetical protein
MPSTRSDYQKPDLFYTGLIDGSNVPSRCPKCNKEDRFVETQGSPRQVKILSGPFYHYDRRETELYFDLSQKYLTCTSCGCDIVILDFQVLVEEISATLPSAEARKFSMKMMELYYDSHDYAIEVLSILRGDFSPENAPEHDYLKELEELLLTPGNRPDD